MYSFKDTSYHTALHSQSAKKIPNILKKRPTPNSASYQKPTFDNSRSRSHYETPFGTFENPNPEKSVEILFLNQSDFVDVSMDDVSNSTLTIIENSVPQETPIKEIVIDKSQIFHLLSVPQRESDTKSTTSQVTKKYDSQFQKVDQNGDAPQNINPETLQKVNQHFETSKKNGNKVGFIQEMRNKLQTLRQIDSLSNVSRDLHCDTDINRNRAKTGSNNSQVVSNSSTRVTSMSSIDDDVVVISDDDNSQCADDIKLTGTYLREIEANAAKTVGSVMPDRPVTPTLPVSICRTCLKPVASSACHRLYDSGRYHRTAHELRQRLSKVAGFIDLQASLNPMVCTECCEAIHAAYNFRTRLKSIEDQIKRRKNGSLSVVDLKAVLEEVAQEKLGIKKKVKDDDARKADEVNLEEYLEKRKRIIDQYMTELEEEAPPQRRPQRIIKLERKQEPLPPTEVPKKFTKQKVLVNNNLRTTGQHFSIKMLENILANSQNGQAIIEIVNEDEERPATSIYSGLSRNGERPTRDAGTSIPNLQNPDSPVPSLDTVVPNLDTVAPSLDTVVPSLEVSESNLETPTPSSETASTMTIVPSLDYSATNLESLVSVGNIVSFTTNTQYSTSSVISTVPSLESSAQSMEPVFITLEPLTLPQMSLIPDLQTLVPNLDLLMHSDESRIQSLDSSIISINYPTSSEIIQESVEDIQKAYVRTSVSVAPNKAEISKVKDPPIGETRELCMDEFLKFRQKKFQKLTPEKETRMAEEPPKPQERVSNLLNELDEEKKKRSEDIYKYVSNANVSRKKKPMVPKSLDLFDAEHDQYFEKLQGDAGCLMQRKWTRFSQQRPQGGDPPYLCDICGKFFPDKPKLKQHRDDHTGSNVTVCSYCGIKIRSHRLNQHVAAQHKLPRFECQECGKNFSVKNLLNKHILVVHRSPNRRCTCQICGAVLKKHSMALHMRSHNSSWKFCDVCKKVLPNQVSWLAHRKRHFSSKVYTCPICSKAITSQHNLKQHVWAFHEDEEAKCCSLCGKFLSRRQSLTRHMKIVHGWRPRTKLKAEESVPQEAPPETKEDEIEQVTTFIVNSLNDMPDKLIELRDELVNDDVMNTPMDVEEIVVPFGSVDDLFPVD